MTARFPVALFSYPLSPGAKLLYLRLAWYCGREAGGAAWAGGGKFKKGSAGLRFVVCNSRGAAAGEMGLNFSIRHARCAVANEQGALTVGSFGSARTLGLSELPRILRLSSASPLLLQRSEQGPTIAHSR
jgi:hypothetical protein